MSKEPYISKLKLRIDWSELDYFKHVNNVSYFKYIQASRVNYWEQTGLSKYHLQHNIGPMLASCSCDFKKPLFYPGHIEIECLVGEIKQSSFTMHHRIYDGQGNLAAEAKDVIVLYDFNLNHKHMIDVHIRQMLEQTEAL